MKYMLIAAAFMTSPVIAETCDNKPVYMVVNGLARDRDRMMTYGKAIQDSGLYATLQGYYLNSARPVAVFEGTVPPNYVTLIVRFPCLANARSFWNSKVYQEKIRPMRLNPSAGDYTVTVYAAADFPAYMKGKVKSGAYKKKFDDTVARAIPQVDGK